jgi:hypothetical protein
MSIGESDPGTSQLVDVRRVEFCFRVVTAKIPETLIVCINDDDIRFGNVAGWLLGRDVAVGNTGQQDYERQRFTKSGVTEVSHGLNLN